MDPSGLKVYPANFIGPLQPGDVRGFIADLHNSALTPLAYPPYPIASQFYGESRECVSLTKHFSGAPCSDCWRAGPPVIGSDIPRGTAVATFDENGRYPKGKNHQNSGIYIESGNAPNTFLIIDQWDEIPGVRPAHPARERGLGPKPGQRSDNSLAYSVITVPYGTTSKLCKCGNW